MPQAIEIVTGVHKQGGSVKGGVFFEVGTGHKPVVPICLYLAGAKEVFTADTNRRLDFDLLKRTLSWFSTNQNTVVELFKGSCDASILSSRLQFLEEYRDNPAELLCKARIHYLAPADASDTGVPDSDIDCHFSVNTLEHIDKEGIAKILREAHRILKPNGLMYHIIDLSDHFQHTDRSISSINFLKYSENEWKRIAGNQFAYCNRLRASDYLKLFTEAGFDIVFKTDTADENALGGGFRMDEDYAGYSPRDLCTTKLSVSLKKNVSVN